MRQRPRVSSRAPLVHRRQRRAHFEAVRDCAPTKGTQFSSPISVSVDNSPDTKRQTTLCLYRIPSAASIPSTDAANSPQPKYRLHHLPSSAGGCHPPPPPPHPLHQQPTPTGRTAFPP